MLQAQNLGIFSQNLPEAANHSCPPNMSEGRTPSHGLKSCHRLSPMAQSEAFSKDFCKNGWRFHVHIHSNHCIDVHCWGFQFVPKVQFGDHISSVLALVWQGWKLKVWSDGPLSCGVVSFCSMAEAAKGYQRLWECVGWWLQWLQIQSHLECNAVTKIGSLDIQVYFMQIHNSANPTIQHQVCMVYNIPKCIIRQCG